MVILTSETTAQCADQELLPQMVLEASLALLILWRILHHVYWKSHPRRVFFHLVLLFSCGFRWVFWFGMCHMRVLSTGIALLWWSNSLLLLCTASIILQWSTARDAGRIAMRELQRVKQFSIKHPLVLLHALHVLAALAGGVLMIVGNLTADQVRETFSRPVYQVIYSVNLLTVLVDAIVVWLVAHRLRARIMAADMADDMKQQSVVQMILLIALMSIALLLEATVSVPVLLVGLPRAWGSLRFVWYCRLKFFVPGVILSLAFLYIMRRIESREPTRLVLVPAASSLVEFEECSSPCMWCEHHRRFHVGSNKWDMTFNCSMSPGGATTDSSYRSAALLSSGDRMMDLRDSAEHAAASIGATSGTNMPSAMASWSPPLGDLPEDIVRTSSLLHQAHMQMQEQARAQAQEQAPHSARHAHHMHHPRFPPSECPCHEHVEALV